MRSCERPRERGALAWMTYARSPKEVLTAEGCWRDTLVRCGQLPHTTHHSRQHNTCVSPQRSASVLHTCHTLARGRARGLATLASAARHPRCFTPCLLGRPPWATSPPGCREAPTASSPAWANGRRQTFRGSSTCLPGQEQVGRLAWVGRPDGVDTPARTCQNSRLLECGVFPNNLLTDLFSTYTHPLPLSGITRSAEPTTRFQQFPEGSPFSKPPNSFGDNEGPVKASGPVRAFSWQFAVALVARSPAVALVARGEEDIDQHGHPSQSAVALVARGEGGLDRTPR